MSQNRQYPSSWVWRFSLSKGKNGRVSPLTHISLQDLACCLELACRNKGPVSWISGEWVEKELGEWLLGGNQQKREMQNKVTCRPVILLWRGSLTDNSGASHHHESESRLSSQRELEVSRQCWGSRQVFRSCVCEQS